MFEGGKCFIISFFANKAQDAICPLIFENRGLYDIYRDTL